MRGTRQGGAGRRGAGPGPRRTLGAGLGLGGLGGSLRARGRKEDRILWLLGLAPIVRVSALLGDGEP